MERELRGLVDRGIDATDRRDPFYTSDLLQTPENLTRRHLRSGADRDVRANAREWKLRGIVMRTAQPRKMKIRLW